MDIRNEILEALKEFDRVRLEPQDYEQMTDSVYSRLSDRLGEVQEKLLNDLTIARSRANQAEAKEVTITQLYAKLLAEVSSAQGD